MKKEGKGGRTRRGRHALFLVPKKVVLTKGSPHSTRDTVEWRCVAIAEDPRGEGMARKLYGYACCTIDRVSFRLSEVVWEVSICTKGGSE